MVKACCFSVSDRCWPTVGQHLDPECPVFLKEKIHVQEVPGLGSTCSCNRAALHRNHRAYLERESTTRSTRQKNGEKLVDASSLLGSSRGESLLCLSIRCPRRDRRGLSLLNGGI